MGFRAWLSSGVRFSALATSCFVALGAGCGSRSSLGSGDGDDRNVLEQRRPEDGPDFLRFDSACVEDWRTLYQSTGANSPVLAVGAGEVFFGRWVSGEESGGIVALDPLSQGDTRLVVSNVVPDDLWVEDDAVWYWQRGELFRAPLSGSARSSVLQAPFPPRRDLPSSVLATPDSFYWTWASGDGGRLDLWQQARPDGAGELIASFDVSDVGGIRLGAGRSGHIVVAGGREAVSVPAGGGAVTALDVPEDGSFAGVDGLGAYYSRPSNRTRRGGRALEYEIRRAPADGSPSVSLWRGPAGKFLGELWPVESGWLATGIYYSDTGPGSVIVHLDAAGRERVLACASESFRMGRPVLWGNALYVMLWPGDGTFSVVEIDLSPSLR